MVKYELHMYTALALYNSTYLQFKCYMLKSSTEAGLNG